MKAIKYLLFIPVLALTIAGCKKPATDTTSPKLIFKFKFDSTQTRYDSFGNVQDVLPAGHAGQSPAFNAMSAHYIELARTRWDSVGKGEVLYHGPQVATGGDSAIDFTKSVFAKDGEMFFEKNLKEVVPGDYEFLRVSLAYQNYDVKMYIDTVISGFGIHQDYPCTVASFVGFNTYITNFKVKNQTLSPNANKKQGYWGFESLVSVPPYYSQTFLLSGQAPAGATTVVNPIFASSPIPSGSCLVTGPFTGGSKLHITGNETKDIVVTVSLSTKKSFEWIEAAGHTNGKWEPTKGEAIVDMGIRGMEPSVQY